MYDQYYGFRRRPFSLNPDPSYLYQSKKHQTALSLMEYALINEAAFCVITGETGMGKTTLVRQLLHQIDTEYAVGVLTSTHQSFSELLKLILIGFGVDYREKDQVDLYKVFCKYLISQFSRHRRAVLIIDEAQNLAAETLEELRMLSNINVDKHNVLQIILVGQESLRDRLQQPGLTQLAQRIAVDYHLEPLDRIETHAYILHRLKIAGGPRAQQIFDLYTCDAVYGHAGGVPRLINMLCDLALVYGYAEQQQILEPELINEVVNDKKKGGLFPLRGQSGPLKEAQLDALLQLHTIQDIDLGDVEDFQVQDEQARAAEASPQDAHRDAPARDRVVIGHIFDQAPMSANQAQAAQALSTRRWSKTWLDAATQLREKAAVIYPPLASFFRMLFKGAYQVGLKCRRWLSQKTGRLSMTVALPKISYGQAFKRYKKPLSVAVVLLAATNLFFLFAAFRADVTSGTANAVTTRKDGATSPPVSDHQPVSQKNSTQGERKQAKSRDGIADASLVAAFVAEDNRESSAIIPHESQRKWTGSIVVEQGQTLSKLLAEVYGRYDTSLLYSVLRMNPHIKSPDLIRVGQTIKLPPLAAIH